MKFEDVYEITDFIGKGAFGQVSKCVNLQTREVFAVKEIDFSGSEEDKKKAQNEAKICGLLDHPSIVHLEDVFFTPRRMLLVLEYLPGGDLFDGVVTRTQFSEKDACACVRQVLKALRYLTRKGIIHRDLKPENLLLSERPSDHRPPIIKLTDFGIAKQLKDGEKTVRCNGSGSPLYLAPETILEEGLTYAVDIWACGVILYLLLVGYPPFWNEQTEFLLLSILQSNYTFPSPYWDTVSEPAKDLIRKMLVVDPRDRITAVEALKHEWVSGSDDIPGLRLNRQSTLVRLTAFNARRKLRGVVLGLIARKRMTFRPPANQVRLTRKDSYDPKQDPGLQHTYEELLAQGVCKMSLIEEEKQQQQEPQRNGNDAAPNGCYSVRAIKPQRNHTYRSAVEIEVNPSKTATTNRGERRRRSQKRRQVPEDAVPK